MTLQRRTVVVGEIICTDRFVHYNRTPILPHSCERADYVPTTRYQAQAQQCSVTASVVKHTLLSVNSSSFHRLLSSASILPLPDPLQHIKLAVPPLPGSDDKIHHLSVFHHSYLGHASSILAPGYTFPLPGSEKTVSVPRRRLHRRDFSNPGT